MRVLLGVTGGIAAYKAPGIVRRLVERGAEVRCALTESAKAFVTPLSLEIVSGHRVSDESWLVAGGTGEEEHIESASWADVLVVAPATANFLARLATGLADDFLTTTALAFRGPIVVAPAMHDSMWEHPATREHVERLSDRGVVFVGPEEGPLASGEVGMGRMTDEDSVAEAVVDAVPTGTLSGRRVLVTAGPTHEPIDPVRFISNRSSGKMGFAIAAEAARRGADTTLVTGPVNLPTPWRVERIDVVTAEEMCEETVGRLEELDLLVMAAAVGDFRPRSPSDSKIKKRDGTPPLELEENPDILGVVRERGTDAVVVGFAAETEDLERNAREKLTDKGADLLVANDVSRTDIGLGSDWNEAVVFDRDGVAERLPRERKERLAAILLDRCEEILRGRGPSD